MFTSSGACQNFTGTLLCFDKSGWLITAGTPLAGLVIHLLAIVVNPLSCNHCGNSETPVQVVLRKATTNGGNPAGGARQYSYLYPYMYEVHHNGESNTMQGYNVVNGTLTNGSARPYKGDRGVFTSDEDIQINIKNDATTLYYQTATYNALTDSFTLTGTRQSQSISGTVPYEINIDKATLSDDSIYAVWTDTDDTKEYFEYHVSPVVTYTSSNDNFTFSVPGNVFYYACWWQSGTEEGITEVVPYRADGDYTEYRNVYNPKGSQGYMCFKGTLGAYMVNLPSGS